MAGLTKFITIPCFTLLLACDANTDKQKAKILRSYKDTPAFVKSFLDAKHDGKFLTAEPGEEWISGCVGPAGIPRFKFNRAFLDITE